MVKKLKTGKAYSVVPKYGPTPTKDDVAPKETAKKGGVAALEQQLDNLEVSSDDSDSDWAVPEVKRTKKVVERKAKHSGLMKR